jgi:hypothetical protein
MPNVLARQGPTRNTLVNKSLDSGPICDLDKLGLQHRDQCINDLRRIGQGPYLSPRGQTKLVGLLPHPKVSG